MKFKLLFVSSAAILLSQAALAATPPQPEACPSVEAIQNVGVTDIYHELNGDWSPVTWKNKFDTNLEWSFVVGTFPATNMADVLAKGNAALADLEYESGPTYFNDGGPFDPSWWCFYKVKGHSTSEIAGVSFTPSSKNIEGALIRRF